MSGLDTSQAITDEMSLHSEAHGVHSRPRADAEATDEQPAQQDEQAAGDTEQDGGSGVGE
ncbi:hypothetical protein [uncultured Jatrophihabitans sp.]|uniref:hypothetical protein n=1 Tax=uncultured Jatrophihabitans sp. TaxID=1610747 RepID=UPI0035CC7724